MDNTTMQEDQCRQLTLTEAGKRLRRKLFKFSGRSSRSEFWLSYVYLYIIFMVLYLACLISLGTIGLLSAVTQDPFLFYGSAMPAIFVVGVLVIIIVFIIISLAMTSRRLHDIGRSAWWLLLMFLPVIGPLILFFWSIYTSDSDNKYGPQPLETK